MTKTTSVAIITYNHPHRKTQDIVYRMILKGYAVTLIIIPWEERKQHNPIYQHRPQDCIDIMPEDLARKLNINFIAMSVEQIVDFNRWDHVVIGGAGIIPECVTKKCKIINIHPGYLSGVRGLDALKWAIYEGKPIGVTSHYINEEPDSGVLIYREIIPVYFEDTFHSLAQRVYDKEIELAVKIIEYIEKGLSLDNDLYIDSYQIVHKRMPKHKEIIMMERFESIRKKSKSKFDD